MCPDHLWRLWRYTFVHVTAHLLDTGDPVRDPRLSCCVSMLRKVSMTRIFFQFTLVMLPRSARLQTLLWCLSYDSTPAVSRAQLLARTKPAPPLKDCTCTLPTDAAWKTFENCFQRSVMTDMEFVVALRNCSTGLVMSPIQSRVGGATCSIARPLCRTLNTSRWH